MTQKWIEIFLAVETSESENDVADSESDQCRDTMAYCSSMVNYCDNDEYQGVRIYCQKTCNSCDVEIDISEVTANATVGESGNNSIFSYSKKMKHALFSVVLKYEIRKRLLQFAESQIKFLACADKPWCENFPFCKDSQALRDRIVGDCPIQCKELRCKAYWKAEITESDPVAIEDAPSQEGTNAFWVFITRGRERATFLNNWHYNNFFITLRAFYLNTLLRVNRESLLSIENWFDERYAKIKFYIYWNLDFFSLNQVFWFPKI